MWAKSDAFHSACSTLALRPSCRPRLAGLLNDGTLRAYNSSTLHLLQLVLLSTVFEFDGYSNNIPSLSCHSGQKELQIKQQATGGWWGRQTPHHLGGGLFPFCWSRTRGWIQRFSKLTVVYQSTPASSAAQKVRMWVSAENYTV